MTTAVRFASWLLALSLVAGNGEAQVIKSLSGQWSGIAHFKARISNQGRTLEDPSATASPEIYMTIDKQGNVSGRTTSNGCQINGLATPWVFDTVLDLQVNFSGCQHAGFNRRFTGKLNYNPQRRTGQMTLNAFDIEPSASRQGYYEISAGLQL